MSCKFCEKLCYSDTCGECINIISLEIERFNKVRHLGPMAIAGCYLNQVVVFETSMAIKGPANKPLGWGIIDKLVKGAIIHA